MISVILKNENGEIVPGKVLPIYPNGMRADMLSSNTPTDLLDGRGTRGMTIFCAADSCRAKILKNYTLEGENIIILEKLENGGSLISLGGPTSLPGFGESALISKNKKDKSDNKVHMYISNTIVNGELKLATVFDMGQPVFLENNRGVTIRLTVKEIIQGFVISEYERMPSGFVHPDSPPPAILPDSSEGTVSDDWEPLPIDRAPPQHEEVIQEAVKALEDVIEGLRGNNGYAANKPEECAEVLETLESGKAKIQTANAILKGTVRRLFNSLSKARETFHKATIEGGKIAVAMDALTRMAKTLWEWLSF